MIKRILITLFLFTGLYGTNYYCWSGATGANNGTSWADAWTGLTGISSLSAGDTVFISGGNAPDSITYTGTLDFSGSGTSGNPIVIKTGQSGVHDGKVVLAGGASYGIVLSNQSYVTIDGQLGSASGENMVVRLHSNDEIRITNPDGNIELKYLEVGPNSNDEGIHIVDNYTDGTNNRIHHCRIHDIYDYHILMQDPGSDPSAFNHVVIDSNEIYNLGHDAIHAGMNAGGLTIKYNEIHTADSGGDQNPVYIDGMHLRGWNYLDIGYNEVYDLEGPDGMYSYIYLEVDLNQSNVSANDIKIYNNLIYQNTVASPGANHVGISFLAKACTSLTDAVIANNTIVDLYGRGIEIGPYEAAIPDGELRIVNNIVYNCHRYNIGTTRVVVGLHYLNDTPTQTTGGWGSSADIIWDYNLVELYSSGTMKGVYGVATGSHYEYPSFKTQGSESNLDGVGGINNDPSFVNWSEGSSVDISLISSSQGVDDGVTLTDFTDDFLGISRPQGSAWDMGSHEYQSGAPSPPSGPGVVEKGKGSIEKGSGSIE
jgi:hypothetical protein